MSDSEEGPDEGLEAWLTLLRSWEDECRAAVKFSLRYATLQDPTEEEE